jgi:predicted cobalt transporter CbtA
MSANGQKRSLQAPSAARSSAIILHDKNNKGAPMTNKEIIQGVYDSFASGDVAAVTAAFADEISWTEADGFPLAGTYIGSQAVVENVFMRLGEIGALGTTRSRASPVRQGWRMCGRSRMVRRPHFSNMSTP